MKSEARSGQVRLAELVAALSLGIDIGFGQPMEHVLRQCLIALRLADRLGLDEQARVAVYYTSLLINVGCHSDAHEQAKWFGDDIVLKSSKYDGRSTLRKTADTLKLLGAGNPPLHRFRIGLSLCSVRDPAAALGQALRVLKPGGRFYFVEHGRSPDPKVQRWQDRFNGVQKAVFVGCHLNRDIERLFREAGFAFDELDKYYLKGQPKMSGFVTRGVARPAVKAGTLEPVGEAAG